MAGPADGEGAARGARTLRRIGGAILAVAAILLLLRLLGPGGRPGGTGPGPAPPLSGRVLGADGAPVPSAVVEAVVGTDGGAAPLVLRSPPSSADGRFVVPGAPERWTSLRVRVRRGPLSVDADLGDAPPPLDVTLRLPATFAVAGIVVADEGGRPLPDVDVRLGGAATRTDALGRFSFPDLPASMADREGPVLEVSAAGRKTRRRALPWDGGEDDLLIRLER